MEKNFEEKFYSELSTNQTFMRLPEIEKQMVVRFASSLSNDKEFNMKITNFILTQLNNDSLTRSVVDEKLYSHLVIPSVSALFRLVKVKGIDDDPIEIHRIYVSSKNFMKLLFTRVLFGRDREFELEKFRAQKPPSTPDKSLLLPK